jgi:hypothetical protein
LDQRIRKDFLQSQKGGARPGKTPIRRLARRKENSKGKMNAVIQTMDWFAWLEADDEDEEYEEE